MNTYSLIRRYLELREEFPQVGALTAKFSNAFERGDPDWAALHRYAVRLYRCAPNNCDPIFVGEVEASHPQDAISQAERLHQRKVRYDYFRNYKEPK